LNALKTFFEMNIILELKYLKREPHSLISLLFVRLYRPFRLANWFKCFKNKQNVFRWIHELHFQIVREYNPHVNANRQVFEYTWWIYNELDDLLRFYLLSKSVKCIFNAFCKLICKFLIVLLFRQRLFRGRILDGIKNSLSKY
jgi:hypothetical protein